MSLEEKEIDPPSPALIRAHQEYTAILLAMQLAVRCGAKVLEPMPDDVEEQTT